MGAQKRSVTPQKSTLWNGFDSCNSRISFLFSTSSSQAPSPNFCKPHTRGGVLEDVLGLEDVLEDTFSSPWPWPRTLKSLALASNPQILENCPVLGSRTALFFVALKTPKTSRKIREHLFLFSAIKDRLKMFLLLSLMGNGASESATVR